MNFSAVERIADAVLFEGYILYPYRPSSLKNRQRWNFGTLYPRAFAERQSPQESCSFQAEVLIEGTAESRISARVRFLQLLPGAEQDPQHWSEGIVRSEAVEDLKLQELILGVEKNLGFEPPQAQPGNEMTLSGRLTLRASRLGENLWRLSAIFSNETALSGAAQTAPNSAQRSAFVSAHLLLGIEDAAFVSLLEPTPDHAAAAAECVNRGVFPVLADGRSHMLCSPIILYDNPQIAPESAGDFFDGTEMDEMLALRVLTLTDEEKAEMRTGDARAAAILSRTESLPDEHFLKLHGAVRGLRPLSREEEKDDEPPGQIEPWNPFDEKPPLASVRVFGIDVRCGDRVRLRPAKQADILDMAMNGKTAIVEAIEQDLEGNIQFAVVLEDDPGSDMGWLRQAGHRFFFSPEEIEPVRVEAS